MHKIFSFTLSLPIRLYRIFISPLYQPTCRYIPSCSEYGKDAIRLHGFKGVWMAFKRICRCHPWSKHDLYDPVDPS